MNIKIFASRILILLAFLNISKIYSQDSITKLNPYLPDIDGILKTKVEDNLENGTYRFSVRNARFGAKGMINKYFGYRAEVDLSDEGKIKMLDAFAKFSPKKNLDFFLGQRKVPFGTDYLRSPADNMFANRSFVAKYVNDGIRDIGFTVNYKFKFLIPLDFWIAAVNGTGNNNPQWVKQPNFASRFSFGGDKSFRFTTNFYQGESSKEKKLSMISGEARYISKLWILETEFLNKCWQDTSKNKLTDQGLYIHGKYKFILNKNILKYISPTARWDMLGVNVLSGNTDAKRFTCGLNFGFEPKDFLAEIRLNYENYFQGNHLEHFDKITLEFIARF